MSAALPGEFGQGLIRGRKGSTRRLNWVYPKTFLDAIITLLSLQTQVRSHYLEPEREQEPGPIARKLQFEMLFIFLLLIQEQSCPC